MGRIIPNMKKKQIPRLYDEAAKAHFEKYDQMLFLSGPRQVGKTTTSLNLKDSQELYYFNWDDPEDRLIILEGPRAILNSIDLNGTGNHKPIVIFDELHKRPKWKSPLKGFYDKYHYQVNIFVTGSARLDVYQKGGDSMMGRYFQYRAHPLSVAELLNPTVPEGPIRPPRSIDDETFDRLWRFGGFPEPYSMADAEFSGRWATMRRKQLFAEEIHDTSQVHNLAQMEVLAEWIRRGVGSQTSYTNLSRRVRVSIDTVRRWMEILNSLYFHYMLRPWSGSIPRTLTKEPKTLLWDWSQVEDLGARCENFIGSHLLKAVHFWTDHGFGDYRLHYLKDDYKREVDFAVIRDGKPWMLVEVKYKRDGNLSPSLHHFAKVTKAPHVFQVVLDMPYVDVDCFEVGRPAIVPARTLLSQLI